MILNWVRLSQTRQILSNYWELAKPKIWYLLVFTSLGGLIVASRGVPPVGIAVLTLTAVTLGSAGANVLTNYIDRDIDAVMNRTKLRPIPSRRVYPAWKALLYGLALTVLSLMLSSIINHWALFFMAFGLFDNVVIYSRIFKRRNPVNIIVGGFSGGAPAMIGYVAVSNAVTLEALLIAAMVVLWIPSHIWSLALKFRDDYERARIPMLPVVINEKTAVRCIASTAILLVVFTLLLYLVNQKLFGSIYLSVSMVTGTILVYLSVRLWLAPNADMAWRLFKFTSPHLALIFVAMMIDSAI
jgi:protoheme IX farnesyltransferase